MATPPLAIEAGSHCPSPCQWERLGSQGLATRRLAGSSEGAVSQEKARARQLSLDMGVHFGADAFMILGLNRGSYPGQGVKGPVTSLRWSVLPQDAERLCVQELVRSHSSSCQDRGVCRERNAVRPSGFSGGSGKQRWWLSESFSSSAHHLLNTASLVYSVKLLHPNLLFPNPHPPGNLLG